MLIKELIESNDPIMDLVRAKEAGFSPDSIDAITDRLTAAMAMATPVTKPNITAQALPKTSQPNKPLATTAKPVATPIAIAQAPGSVAWTQVRDYLASKGLSTAHIIGMLANIEHESGFRPQVQVVDSNGLPSGGLFQHNGPRFTTLMHKLGKGWSGNWKGQIDFALSEPDGQRYLTSKFSDPHAASKWWTVNFERPAKASVQAARRAKTATKFAQR